MIKAATGNINLTVPRGYSEMSQDDVLYISGLMVSQEPEESLLIKSFIRLSGIRPVHSDEDHYVFVKKGIEGTFKMSVQEVSYCTKKINFITQNYIGMRPISRIGKFLACDIYLRDTYFTQYLTAENNYQAYLFTKDEKYLHKFIACFWMPKGGDYKYIDFNSAVKYIAKKATPEQVYASVMWYIGVKEYFENKFGYFFKRIPAKTQTEAPNMFAIMKSQIRLLTDGDITKDDAILYSNTWDALSELDAKSREFEELNEKLKK